MALTTFPLRALSLYEEPDGSFAVDHSGTPGDFLALPAQPDSLSWTPSRELLDPNILQQYKHGRTKKVHGPRAVDLSATVPLGLTGTLADSSTAALGKADSALLRLLAITMGGIETGSQGSTSDTGSTASVVNVQAGHGSRWKPGGAMGWVNSAGQMEISPVASISTDAITLKHAFSGAPSSSDALYNAATLYLDDSGTHVQWLAEGKEADDYWSLRGTQLSSLSIGVNMRGIPTLQFSMQGAEWEYLGSGSLSGATYSNFEPLAFDAGFFLAQQEGTATRNQVSIADVSLNTGLTYIEVPDPNGTNTILEYIQQHTPSVGTGSFTPYYEDQTWFTAWTNRTIYNICLQIGRSSSGGVLFEFAGSQLGPVTAPQSVADGLTGVQVPWESGLDGDATDKSTALRRSPVRIHFVG